MMWLSGYCAMATVVSTLAGSAPAVPPDDASSLRLEVERLQAAGEATPLLQFCDSGRPERVFANPTELAIWQALCRGRGYLLLQDWEKAERAFQTALGRAPSLPNPGRAAAREYTAEAHFRLGEMFEQRFCSYALCLLELGDTARAPREAAARGDLQRAAERAYREVLKAGCPGWSARALFRITSMSDFFYRAVSGTPAGLRSVRVPAPLIGAAMPELPLTGAYLDPDRSSLRRSILLSYRKLALRVRDMPEEEELAAAAARSLEDFERYLPAIENSVAPQWATRSGEDAGIVQIQRREVGFEVVRGDGRRERWSSDEALTHLRTLLAPLAAGRWAPLAAVGLGDLRDRQSLPLLLDAIGLEQDPELQVAAVYALGQVGDASAVGPLVAAFVRAQQARPRDLFKRAGETVFGLEENALRALAAIGRRDPRAVERLLDEPGLPPREAAFVLWSARSRELYGLYARLRDEKDPVAAAYGLAAIVDLDGSGARWLLVDQGDEAPLLRCVKEHLLASLER
ncbi:MAG: HEAT repeat domain-containing protein [Deltaproteobacteria bacterium]|nr:HEAT repeat domain-containing protein [Deltaproteobacteria bacterium]